MSTKSFGCSKAWGWGSQIITVLSSLQGAGTDEACLIEILSSRSNAEIKEITRIYKQGEVPWGGKCAAFLCRSLNLYLAASPHLFWMSFSVLADKISVSRSGYLRKISKYRCYEEEFVRHELSYLTPVLLVNNKKLISETANTWRYKFSSVLWLFKWIVQFFFFCSSLGFVKVSSMLVSLSEKLGLGHNVYSTCQKNL